MKFLMKLKAWQIFLIIVAGSLIATTIYSSVLVVMFFKSSIDKTMFLRLLTIYFAGISIPYIMHFFWTWNIGFTLNRHLPEDLQKSSTFFKFSMIFSFAYSFTFVCGFLMSAAHPMSTAFFVGVVPFHAVVTALSAYNMFFAARSLKMYELKREVQTEEFLFNLFMILLFPIGIFFLQPKINQFAKEIEDRGESL